MVTDVGTSLHIDQHRDEEPTYYRGRMNCAISPAARKLINFILKF